MANLGFVGLGTMGSRIVQRLLASGFPVVGYNRTPTKAAALVQAGVSGVGFDGPSADPVDSVDYELHHVWLAGGAIILENLAAMDQLP